MRYFQIAVQDPIVGKTYSSDELMQQWQRATWPRANLTIREVFTEEQSEPDPETARAIRLALIDTVAITLCEKNKPNWAQETGWWTHLGDEVKSAFRKQAEIAIDAVDSFRRSIVQPKARVEITGAVKRFEAAARFPSRIVDGTRYYDITSDGLRVALQAAINAE